MIVVRSASGAGNGVGCLDFLNSVAHARFADEINAQNSPIRKGFVKIFTSYYNLNVLKNDEAGQPSDRCA